MRSDVTTRRGARVALAGLDASRPSAPSRWRHGPRRARRSGDRPSDASRARPIPRVGLKPGRTDAGVAAKNMVLVSSMAQAGRVLRSQAAGRRGDRARTPSTRGRQRRARRSGARAAPAGRGAMRAGAPAAQPAVPAAAATSSTFANSDLAFKGVNVVMGNFHGFNTYNVENTRRPQAGGLDRLPRRPGRRLGLRQPAVHVGGADARPHRLRHPGRGRTR